MTFSRSILKVAATHQAARGYVVIESAECSLCRALVQVSHVGDHRHATCPACQGRISLRGISISEPGQVSQSEVYTALHLVRSNLGDERVLARKLKDGGQVPPETLRAVAAAVRDTIDQVRETARNLSGGHR